MEQQTKTTESCKAATGSWRRIAFGSIAGVMVIGGLAFLYAERGSHLHLFDRVRQGFDNTRRTLDQRRRSWEQERRAAEQARRQALAGPSSTTNSTTNP
jgi:hypothetical protein